MGAGQAPCRWLTPAKVNTQAWEGGNSIQLAGPPNPASLQLTPGPHQLLTRGQSPHLHLLLGLVPQDQRRHPVHSPSWALAFDKHPHFPEEDTKS